MLVCKAKVVAISKDCQRLNCKYSDTDFDIEWDLIFNRRNCLDYLTIPHLNNLDQLLPKSVKRVGDIFDDPKFYVDGPTANDTRQGRIRDCWLIAALAAMGNKQGLIERVCVARDEEIGVYGFVFFPRWQMDTRDHR